MKFRLLESQIEMYSGWAQEDIDLYESIDWDEVEEGKDYDAGFAYLDSAILDSSDEIKRVETEFHKFFKRDPMSKPYYMPVESRPFDTHKNYIGPINNGNIHRDYEVYNKYDTIKDKN